MYNISFINQPSEEVLSVVREAKNKGLLSSIKLNRISDVFKELKTIQSNDDINIDAYAYICSLLYKKIGTKLFEFGECVIIDNVKFKDDLIIYTVINRPRNPKNKFYSCVFEGSVALKLNSDNFKSIDLQAEAYYVFDRCEFKNGIRVLDRSNNILADAECPYELPELLEL